MELQELVDRIQRWKTRIAADEAGEMDVQPDEAVDADGLDESAVVAADAMIQEDDIEAEPMAEDSYEEEGAAADEEEPQVDEEELQADEAEPLVDEEELQADEEETPSDDESADADVDIDVDVDVESDEGTPDSTGEIDIDDVEEI